jgi:ubiquinone/menaquinone biosynthesis C-methylase UbiE
MLERVLEPEAMDTAEEAEGYDSMDHTEANRNFIGRLMELGATGHLLDLGCGPAHMAITVCTENPDVRVTGLDLAHHMLRVAQANVDKSSCADRIKLVHGDAKDVGFDAGSFDAVYSNTILHHIPDPRPFLTEAARLVKPGGVLLIRDLYRPESQERIAELVTTYADGCDEYQRGLFGDSLHAAFTPEELRDIADECGLSNAEIVIDTDRHMSLQIRAQ